MSTYESGCDTSISVGSVILRKVNLNTTVTAIPGKQIK
jgi:serine acetyltransferase